MVLEIPLFWCGVIIGAVAAIILLVALAVWYGKRNKNRVE
jgi:putative Ca2+/H+ antiporter (TMEM165/GDT1 family)